MDNYSGRILGHRYILKEIIGVGGMAVVYKAIDNIDNKTVAVKILKEEYSANDDFRRRFRNESKAIAVLSHPNIVKVYDVGLGDKIQYIVMEYIEGITLKEYIQQNGIIDWHEAVNFTAQILKALQHAHEKGVIHRDIKPQNIMLLRDNRTIKVTDFGIARFNANKSDTKTMADGAIGSVHYISPEQARGDIVDNRTDIYSAGVVLYEMITGQLPFQSDSAVSVAIMQLQKKAVMPRTLNPDISIGIEQITMRAMQKNPRDRYQSAAEMLLDIEEFRRNPNIKFDYGYFVDTQPTKYVTQQRQNPANYASGTPITADNGSQYVTEYKRTTVITPEVDPEEARENEEIAKRNYTVPVLLGIILVIIVIVVGIAWYFFTSSDEVTIPNFVGQNIDEIRDDDDYKYFFENDLIEENLVYTTEYEEGEIFRQSKEAGTKIQITNTASSIIKLDIAYTSESMTVPTIEEGTKLQEARSILLKMGFNVVTEGVVNSELDESTVIELDPPSGESVAYGSTVTIYYAVDDADKVAVPQVVGEKQSVAQSELEALGFKAVNVEYKESTSDNAGLVIEQSIAADTTVIASNTEITIVVGTTSTKQTTISITLPDESDAESVYETIYVYVGDELYKTIQNVELNGSGYSITIDGSTNTTFEIYIDDQVVCSGNVDFTVSPPAVTNKSVKQYKYSETTTAVTTTAAAVTTTAVTTTEATISLPSYSGMSYVNYYNALINLGFDNIEKIDVVSSLDAGQVVRVEAEKTTFSPSEVASAAIVVYVSTGPTN